MNEPHEIINAICKPGRVDWTYTGPHTTKAGKVKQILQGVPCQGFWNLWKQAKIDTGLRLAIRAAGVTLYNHGRKPTGQHRTHKGITKEVFRSQWEVTIWINKANRPALMALGFEIEEAAPVEVEANAPEAIEANPF